MTEAQAHEAGLDVIAASIELPGTIARPDTFEEHPRGTLGVVADGGRGV